MFFAKASVILSVLPFLFLLTQINSLETLSLVVASTTGLVGSVFILWQFLLGIRFVSRVFTKDYISLMNLHKFLGTYGLIFIFFHPIIETITYAEGVFFIFLPDFSTELGAAISFGRIAFFLLILTWITSVLLRKRWISYRVWHNLHYINYFLIPLIFIHANNIGSFLNTSPPLKLYWYILMSLFVLILIVRLSKLFNIGVAKYRLTAKKVEPSGITIYTFTPVNTKMIPVPGQFAYIKPTFFGESHPFSVMKFDDLSGKLQFGIKTVGKFTRQLEDIKEDQIVYVDGPYGVFTTEGHNTEVKVVFAGGIGITPFVELTHRFGNKNTYMFYSNKVLESAVNRSQFIKELGKNYKDVITGEEISNVPVISGRIDEDIIKKNLKPEILKKAIFFICGSPQFMRTVVDSLKKLGMPDSKIYTEDFSL